MMPTHAPYSPADVGEVTSFEVASFEVDCADLRAVFTAASDKAPCLYRRGALVDETGCTGTGRDEMLAIGVAYAADAGSPADQNYSDRADFEAARERLESVIAGVDPALRDAIRMVGWTSFAPNYRSTQDRSEDGDLPSWSAFARRQLYIPQVLILRRDGGVRALVVSDDAESTWRHWRAVVERAPASPVSTIGSPGGSTGDSLHTRWLDRDNFRFGVRQVVEEQVAPKVVLARRALVEAAGPIDVGAVLNSLAERYPSCTLFAISPAADDHSGRPVFVGATPERLARVEDGRVETMALAGTARSRPGEPPIAEAEQALLSSTKDRDEHRFVLDMIVEHLRPLCRKLQVDDALELHRLANVSHLMTTICGELQDGVGLARIADALHPTPAVCGTPRQRARELIDTFEGYDRGLYAGTFGWMDPKGNGEFDVALRCGLIEGRRALLFAGAGITADSDVDVELDETRNKFAPLLQAIGRG